MTNLFESATTLDEVVGQLAGFASMCWEPKPHEQVFDSATAAKACADAVKQIEALGYAQVDVTRWQYGVRVEDGEIVASHASWHWEPFLTEADARASGFEGTIVRRHVFGYGEWEAVP